MIEWVATQPQGATTDMYEMHDKLQECWKSDSCALCVKYHMLVKDEVIKKDCPLGERRCEGSTSCCKEWEDVNHSLTWGDWLIKAEILIQKLRKIRC